jgi:hypothetical protein
MDGEERCERDSDVDLASSGTSSPMCWWWDWPIVRDDSGELRRYHAIYNKVSTKMSKSAVWQCRPDRVPYTKLIVDTTWSKRLCALMGRSNVDSKS